MSDRKRAARSSGIVIGAVVLSLIGLGAAIYLAIEYSRGQAPYCGDSGGCEAVRSSGYVTIVSGVLDVPTLGIIGFSLLTVLGIFRWRMYDRFGTFLPLVIYGVSLTGFLYSAVYLTILEAFVIHAWCYWCVAIALTITDLFVLSTIDLRRTWFGGEKE